MHLPEGWLFAAGAGSKAGSLPGPRPDRWLWRIEHWHPRLIALAALCLFAGFAIWRWGLSLLVGIALMLIPDAMVHKINTFNLAVIDRMLAHETPIDPQRRREVQRIFDDLRRHAPESPRGDYRLLFCSIPEMGPNAFARPGGTIAIIDELLERFDDPNVVAAILGHEMAHVSQKHSLAQLYRAGSTYLFAGDPDPLLDTILHEGNTLLSLAYSRGSMNSRRTVWASGSPGPPVTMARRWPISSSSSKRNTAPSRRAGCKPIRPIRTVSGRSGP